MNIFKIMKKREAPMNAVAAFENDDAEQTEEREESQAESETEETGESETEETAD